MREIKFRGIGIKSGQMVYGNCVSHTIFSAKENEETSWIFVIRRPTDIQIGTGWIAVKADTVGQFTGLKDKDGKEIYEGDIVKINQPERITQTHTGDNIPRGSYTEPLEPNIKTLIDAIVWDKEGGLFKFGENRDPIPLSWVIKEYGDDNEANQAFGGHWNKDRYWPEELEYLLDEFKLKDLESLLIHISGCEIIGNIYENSELLEAIK